MGCELLDDGAGVEGTAVVCAVVDDGLEGCDVPSVDEVAVESVTGAVAVGEDEGLFAVAPFAGKLVGVVEYFEEQGDELDGMSAGAGGWVVVCPSSWIGDVRFVVSAVHVDAIPARGEEDLSA